MWQKWWTEHKDKVSFVAIAEDNQSSDAIIPWVKKADATFTVLHDQENVLYERYNPNVTSTMVVNEEGRLVRPWRWADIMEPAFAKDITRWALSGSTPDGWLEMEALVLPDETPELQEAFARLRLATGLLERGKKPEGIAELKP